MTSGTESLLAYLRRILRRGPVPPCSPLGHTFAYGPWLKPGDRCYCGRGTWRVSRD